MTARAVILLILALALAGCATDGGSPPPPRVIEVPVVVKCATDPGASPAYPDTDEALAESADIFGLVRTLKAGRKLRMAREVELNAALAGCK